MLDHYADNGLLSPKQIAAGLLTTVEDVARSAGLGRDAVMRQARVSSPKVQSRLREMVEIINRVSPRMGSDLMAYAWYRSEPLPGFSGLTARQLVEEGRAGDVMLYLDRMDAGIFA